MILIYVIPAIITAIIGPLLTYFIIDWHQNRHLKIIRAGRRKALDGNWQGSVHQEVGPDRNPIDAKLYYSITASRKVVRGEGTYLTRWQDRDRVLKFTASGGFFHDRFLKIDYKNADDSAIQFGSAALELSADGKKLTGCYSGYGALSEHLVQGTIQLEKRL